MLIELEDKLEQQLPRVGHLSVRDPETGERFVIDTNNPSVRDAYAERVAAQKAKRRDRLRRLGVEHLLLRSADDTSTALVKFLRSRARSAA